MAINYLPGTRNTIRTGSIGETKSFSEKFQLVTDGVSDIHDCMDLAVVPQHGSYYPYDPRYRCNGVELNEVGTRPGGGYTIDVSITWETRLPRDATDQNGDPITWETPPWLLPIEDFTNGSVPIEESIKWVYVPDGEGSYKQVPFRNTAGTALIGTRNRYLYTFGFSYNVTPDFSPIVAFNYNGKVNAEPITVAGVTFDAMQLQITSISATPRTDYNEDGSVRWQYKKVSAQFQADPQTFYRSFANIGLFVKRSVDSLQCRLWQGIYGKDADETLKGTIFYGTRDEVMEKVKENLIDRESAEAITEPMFLLNSGLGITPIDPNTGLQEPKYNRGCPDEPISFAALRLPSREP